MLPRIVSGVVGWARAQHMCNLDFENHGVTLWNFIRMWEKDTFCRVAVTVSDCFSSGATHKLSVLASVVAAVGGSVSLVAVSGGSHALADTCDDYLGSGYHRKLVEYAIFDLRLQKKCLQKVSCSVFDSLDPFSLMDFFVTRLKKAEHHDWWMSRSGLCCAIIKGELFVPSLVEVVSLATSRVHGFSSGSTSGRLGERPTRQLSGISHSPLLFQLQFLSHAHLVVLF